MGQECVEYRGVVKFSGGKEPRAWKCDAVKGRVPEVRVGMEEACKGIGG